MRDADVLIVGAGPAGSTCAALLARAGLRVLLVERAEFPQEKTCGGWMSPACRLLLSRLGMWERIAQAHPHPLIGVTITSPSGTSFPATYPGTPAFSLPRRLFDALLAEEAIAAGAALREGFTARALTVTRRRVEVTGTGKQRSETLTAPLLIAADGRHSTIARRLGLRRTVPPPQRIGFITDVRNLPGPDDERGEVEVGEGGYAILNPRGGGEATLGIVRDLPCALLPASSEEVMTSLVRGFPRICQRLAGAERTGLVRRLTPLAGWVDPPHQDRILLIGDAASWTDPLTGEGIYRAMRSGEIAASVAVAALQDGDLSSAALEEYRRRCEREWRRKTLLSRLLQQIAARPAWSDRVARHLARSPALADLLLGAIGDLVPAARIVSLSSLARLLAAPLLPRRISG